VYLEVVMMADNYFDEKKGMTSDFNEAKLQIFRLNNSWERYSTAIRNGNFLDNGGANWELDDIFGELSTDAEQLDVNKEENERYHHKLDKLNSLISSNRDNEVKLYKIMRTKEKILRRLQDESGKGSKRSSIGDDDDIDS